MPGIFVEQQETVRHEAGSWWGRRIGPLKGAGFC